MLSRENKLGIPVQVLPETAILWIPAEFLEAVGSVRSQQDVDAVIAEGILKRREHPVFHCIQRSPANGLASVNELKHTHLNYTKAEMRKVLLAGMVALTLSGGVHAAYTITVTQVGPDVVATGNGSINLTALTPSGVNLPQPTWITPNNGIIVVGTTGTNVDVYDGLIGPNNFGAGGQTNPTSTSGTKIGWGLGTRLVVGTGYVSGTPSSGGATWNGTTIAALGATPGT